MGNEEHQPTRDAETPGRVQTVLGPIAPGDVGVALMHEHTPIIDWSELYETPPAPIAPVREHLLETTASLLDAFHATLADDEGPGTVVDATPIRVGRYPDLLVDLARRTKVHIVAATGFWTEALAPHHPWAARLVVASDGADRMAELFIREITQGIEDPTGGWGERFTDVKAGIIKLGTSSYLTPGERVCHRAAAVASRETGCAITTHTNMGGGLEEAELLLAERADPARVIIGHQGHLDDRENEEAYAYHEQIADLGCYVQFDRVGHPDYAVDKQARQIVRLIEAGHVDRILLGHDSAPFWADGFADAGTKGPEVWQPLNPDFTIVATSLREALAGMGVSREDLRRILVENPMRALAFPE